MYSSCSFFLSSFVVEQPGYRLSADNEAWVSFACGSFHQPVRAVPCVEPERLPHEQQRSRHDETDTYPLVHACHEQDDEHHEDGKQAAAKDKEVLAFQPLELHRLSDTPVYRIFRHSRRFIGRTTAG